MALWSRRRYVVVTVIAIVFITFFYTLRDNVRLSLDNSAIPNELYIPPNDGRSRWRDLPQRYPVRSLTPLPSRTPKDLPRIQHDFALESQDALAVRRSRQAAVKETFQRCWKAYKEHAWMKDEVTPISGSSRTTFGGWAATLVDSLDSLWILDMKREFEEAVAAVDALDFGPKGAYDGQINVFETTIRYLGGFLSAYDLSHDERLLHKAVEVGDMVYAAFDTPNRMPITRWQPRRAAAGVPQEADEVVLVAEIGSLSLEFTRLSQLTGDAKWYDAIDRITKVFDKQQRKTKLPGMWPIVVNAKEQDFTRDNVYTLGAMSDSLYEYLPKMHALLGGQSKVYKKLYEKAMSTAIRYNFFRPMTPSDEDILVAGKTYVYDSKPYLDPQGQHLVCFAGGMLGLGGRLFQKEEHMELAHKLTDGCIWAYRASPLGIMPETFHMIPCPSTSRCEWNETVWHAEALRQARSGAGNQSAAEYVAHERLSPGFSAIGDRRYILRPEAIESVFLLYRMTDRADLPEAAWAMFENIERHTKTELANAALSDVTVDFDPPKADSMESFWLAETLKYFYLIFSEPGLISLDEYVFNTEAHPFRRPRRD